MSRPIGRLLAAASLVIGPAAVVLVSAASPASGEPGPKTLAKFAGHSGQVHALLAGDFLTLVLLPAIGVVALLAWPRSPKLAVAGGTLGLLGIGASCTLAMFDIMTETAVDSDDPRLGEFIRKVADSGWAGPFFLTFLFGTIVGFGLLGTALWRSEAVPRWAAGAVIAYVPAAIISAVAPPPIGAIGGLVLLVGFAGCAAQVLREGVSAPVRAAVAPALPAPAAA
ncbi:hypothetical protein [Frankia tisae]|uniref:hypothetical protein n=1 Tax=Frankia tisae TaxID=2950104 RepID=UPI0021C21D63|nr:hypothetical protein [Frankia tisae]